ncbi:MAG: lmo0937 family membrane protein [Myxococcales bacterium]|nr:lmo0937 family membrane protein [Myxococcales bacterium]
MLNLLWALAAIFIVLWVLGVSTTFVNVGGLIHILLVLAVISVLARVIMGRRI